MAAEYKKLSFLGAGSFGKVWLVNKESTNSRYVLKEIAVRSLTQQERDQCMTEVEILAKCKHLNIIKYRNAFVDCENGFMCIVMEYAPLGDLQHTVDSQKGILFDESRVIEWFTQICFGLKHIHGLNILHRDLKTQNIFLGSNNLIKIGDFGISKILNTSSGYANTVIGTPVYLSPEIYKRQPYNSKSDMWAAGCVLYHLCALKHPFNATDFSQLVGQIMHGTYEPLPSQFSQLSRDLVQVLLRHDPNGRPSAAQVLGIRAMQPYVDAYVERTQSLREKNSASPMPRLLRHEKIVKASPSTSGAKEQITSGEKLSNGTRDSSSERIASSEKSKKRLKSQADHSYKEQCSIDDADKENLDPSTKVTPDIKSKVTPDVTRKDHIQQRMQIHTDKVQRRQSRSALRAIDKNVKSAEEPKQKIRSIVEPSPKQSLFREIMKKREQPIHVSTSNENANQMKEKRRVNLKGGKTYIVKRPIANQSPGDQPLAKRADQSNGFEISLVKSASQSDQSPVVSMETENSGNTKNENVLTKGASQNSKEGANIQRDVCKYLWQAALKGPADSFSSQEMIRAFLEGRLSASRVKSVYKDIKENLENGSDFENVPSFKCDDVLGYVPLFMKLIEQENQ